MYGLSFLLCYRGEGDAISVTGGMGTSRICSNSSHVLGILHVFFSWGIISVAGGFAFFLGLFLMRRLTNSYFTEVTSGSSESLLSMVC